MHKYNYKLYFLDEVYYILKFHEFSWMDLHPIRIASKPNHSQNRILKKHEIWSQNLSISIQHVQKKF